MSRRTIHSAEIIRLKEKNDNLIEELKRLNSQLDSKLCTGVGTIKPAESTENHSTDTGKIESEIECLQKMAVLYQKEIDALQGKLRIRAGPERVMELEKKIAAHHKKHEELAKKIKELEKKIKDTDKVFEKQTGLRESGNEKIEVMIFGFWVTKK